MDHPQSYLLDLEYVEHATVLAMIDKIVHYITQIEGAKVEQRRAVAHWEMINEQAMFGLTRTSL